jgi:hypothetical protein
MTTRSNTNDLTRVRNESAAQSLSSNKNKKAASFGGIGTALAHLMIEQGIGTISDAI